MARSISPASRTLTGLNSTPNDGATAWMAPNWAIPDGYGGIPKDGARVTRGAICFEQFQPFPADAVFEQVNPVMLPPGRARLSTNPRADRIDDLHEHDRHGAGRLLQRRHGPGAIGQDDVRRERDQFGHVSSNRGRHRLRPSGCRSTRRGRWSSPRAPAPAGTPQPTPDIADLRGCVQEDANTPHPLALLRSRRNRPRRRRAAEQRDELAALFTQSPRRRGRETWAKFLDRAFGLS